MAFFTDFPADLEQREAEQSGGDLFDPYWQPRTKALAATFLLESAIRWLQASEQCTSLMAIHAVTQGAHDIERAASLLKDDPDLAWDAMQLVWRCGEGMKATAFPYTDGLADAAEALQARVEQLIGRAA